MQIINQADQVINYEKALKNMNNIVNCIKNRSQSDTIWLLQHENVYTIGGLGNISDVLEPSIPVVHTNRGGKVTYHGPGQLIAYFMLDIRKNFQGDVHKFVHFLEEMAIAALDFYKIKGERIEKMTGIWVNNAGKYEKIAAIGVRISGGISYHGISINISPDLSKFSGIVPCGIKDFGICSLESLKISTDIREFAGVFLENISNYEISKAVAGQAQ